MDIKQYIESGIIESFVLGATSEQEAREVSCMASIYPEIKDALVSAQKGVENYIESIAVQPPEFVKKAIIEAINRTPQFDPLNSIVSEETKVRKLNFQKLSLAASVLVIGGLIYFLSMNSAKIQQQNELLSEKNSFIDSLAETFEGNTRSYNESIDDLKSKNDVLLATETKLVALNGSELSPDSKVRVFWNQNLSKVIVIQDQLPAPNEKQYQLWAISEGTPVSLGVLGKNEKRPETRSIDLDKVDAFAITLEVDGGAPTPDLGQLYVIGNT